MLHIRHASEDRAIDAAAVILKAQEDLGAPRIVWVDTDPTVSTHTHVVLSVPA